MPAVLVENGVEHPVKFRYRGMYSASHYLGGKKSFRLSLKKNNPFAPCTAVERDQPEVLQHGEQPHGELDRRAHGRDGCRGTKWSSCA